MNLNNLVEYAKLGVGSAFTVSGIRWYVVGVLSRDNMQEALFRTITEATPEKLIQARQSLESALNNQDPSYITLVSVALGAGLVASGVYNLVRNYRSEKAQ